MLKLRQDPVGGTAAKDSNAVQFPQTHTHAPAHQNAQIIYNSHNS